MLSRSLHSRYELIHTAKLLKIIEKTKRFPDYFLTKSPHDYIGDIMRKTMPFAIFWILMNGLMVFLGLHVI